MRKDGQPRAFLRVKLKNLYNQVQSGELSRSSFADWLREYRYKHWSKGIDEGVKGFWSKKKPLSNEEVESLAENCWYTDEDLQIFNHKKFAKLLEERHGIK